MNKTAAASALNTIKRMSRMMNTFPTSPMGRAVESCIGCDP